MELNRNRLCVCYIVSSLLITIFIYSLISSNLENNKKLNRLKEDVDDIALVVLQTRSGYSKSSQSLTKLVDNMLKKRLSGIWDELYALKKTTKEEIESIGKTNGMAEDKTQAVAQIEERVNYAAEELGAKILAVDAEPVCAQNFIKTLLGMEFAANPPIKMLRGSMEPGSCFAFKGEKGEVTIQLAHEIILDQVVIQHISKKLSPTEDTSSAPKDFRLIGIDGDFEETIVGKYRYDNSPNKLMQYYNIAPPNRFEYLKFQFETNHGNPNYTCIYRIGAFGKLALKMPY